MQPGNAFGCRCLTTLLTPEICNLTLDTAIGSSFLFRVWLSQARPGRKCMHCDVQNLIRIYTQWQNPGSSGSSPIREPEKTPPPMWIVLSSSMPSWIILVIKFFWGTYLAASAVVWIATAHRKWISKIVRTFWKLKCVRVASTISFGLAYVHALFCFEIHFY